MKGFTKKRLPGLLKKRRPGEDKCVESNQEIGDATTAMPSVSSPLASETSASTSTTAVSSNEKGNKESQKASPPVNQYKAACGGMFGNEDDRRRSVSIRPGVKKKTKEELAIFYHATLGYPEVESFCEAIDDGYLASYPGLTSSLIRNHLPVAQQKTKQDEK